MRNPIYVTDDDLNFVEDEFEKAPPLVDLANTNVVDFLERQRKREATYATAPFDAVGKYFRFFPGEYTIWSGKTGNGKTTLVKQLVCHLMHEGHAAFIASFEQQPDAVLYDLCKVAHGTDDPNADNVQWCFDTWAQKLKLWSYRRGRGDHQRLFGIIRFLAKQGVRHAVIDSLMCLDVPADDWEAQRNFATNLSALCESTGVHVHLVAHPRKQYRADQPLDVDDVAGSADIGRLAANVLVVKRADPEPGGNDFDVVYSRMSVAIRKQRYTGGFRGDVDGVFNRKLKQWKERAHDDAVTRYLPPAAYGDLTNWAER